MRKLVTRKDFAALVGVSEKTVSNYIRQGKISKAAIKGRKIRLLKAITDLRSNLDSRRIKKINLNIDIENFGDLGSCESNVDDAIVATVIQSGFENLTMVEAQTWQSRYRAALLKQEYEKNDGKLVDLTERQKLEFDAGRRVRDAILNVPARISAIVAAESDPIAVSNIITDELIQALEELCN